MNKHKILKRTNFTFLNFAVLNPCLSVSSFRPFLFVTFFGPCVICPHGRLREETTESTPQEERLNKQNPPFFGCFIYLKSYNCIQIICSLSKFLRRSLMIFIIKGFRTIIFIFIVISMTFRPICPPAFLGCNVLTWLELLLLCMIFLPVLIFRFFFSSSVLYCRFPYCIQLYTQQ